MKRRIRIDHTHKHHGRKVEPLGNHLSANQNINFAGAKCVERAFVAASRSHGVGVHAGHAGFRKADSNLFFKSLRAGASLGELWGVAGRTLPWKP